MGVDSGWVEMFKPLPQRYQQNGVSGLPKVTTRSCVLFGLNQGLVVEIYCKRKGQHAITLLGQWLDGGKG